MKQPQLLPCPFCGEVPQIMKMECLSDYGPTFFDINCICGVSIGKEESIGDLINRWNARVAT